MKFRSSMASEGPMEWDRVRDLMLATGKQALLPLDRGKDLPATGTEPGDTEALLEEQLEAFLLRDYARCEQLGQRLLFEHPTLVAVQLYLISLLRQGKARETKGLIGHFLLALAVEGSWERVLLELTLGLREPADALARARDARQECQARFYAGARLLTEGRLRAAAAELDACLATGAECIEVPLALLERASPPPLAVERDVIVDRSFTPTVPSGAHVVKSEEPGPRVAPPAPQDSRGRMNRLLEEAGELSQQGRYREALPLVEEACALSRELEKETHSHILCLRRLALLHQSLGDYKAAEPLFRQALEIRRKSLGRWKQDPLYFTSLAASHLLQNINDLGMLYKSMGDYPQAEPLFHETIEISRAVSGEQHPDHARALGNLADLYLAMGDYEATEPLLLRALEIQRALGEKNPLHAIGLNNLANLYWHMGRLTEAEPLFRQALEMKRSAVAESDPSFAIAHNNLGQVYMRMGDFAAAEPLLRRTLEILLTAPGEKHSLLASALNNLGQLYYQIGRPTSAESYYCQAVDLQRRVLGEHHPDYAGSLHNLATLYESMGRPEEAEALFQQALEILRTALGEEHPQFAGSLNNLAGLYVNRGDFADAEPLYRHALDVLRRRLGEGHPSLAATLVQLAGLCAATDRPGEALSLMRQAAAIREAMIGQVFRLGSEGQRASLLKSLEAELHAFLSLVLRYFADDSAVVAGAMDIVLRRKGIGAEALAVQRDAVLGGRHPDLLPQLAELRRLRIEIARTVLAGPGTEGAEAYKERLAQAKALRERLEADLARQIPEMSLDRLWREADCRSIARALPDGTALVDFVQFQLFGDALRPLSRRYAAFVLHAGYPASVRLIDLGDAEDIDRRIAELRAALTGEDARRSAGLARGQRGSPGPAGREGEALRAAVLDPLLPALDRVDRLLLAPDGDLARLPFEVLPSADGRRLIDVYRISYVGSGRDVLRWRKGPAVKAAPPVVVADPDFDLAGAEAASVAPAGTLAAGRGSSRFADFQSLCFAHLPGTRVEGERVAAMLGVSPWLGRAALEARLKACASPKILHIATHGYFFERWAPDAWERPHPLPVADETLCSTHPGWENPLLRSGLALAGANTWCRGGALPAEAEDGILTAEDVSGMDLLGTELVVLSACETGLGEVRTGEGVFGLRRAFLLAGAQSLVMSLWKVPDTQTQELMEDFYRRVLEGQGVADALRDSQRSLAAKHPEPLFWGAFICQGDPGPLTAVPS